VLQEPLFPDLDSWGQPTDTQSANAPTTTAPGWRIGDDVHHRESGHGWVQGAGHGVMTVRFETRASGPGPARTLPIDDPDVSRANPVDSLDWPEFVNALVDESTPATDDLADG
jgi:DNA polymerase-4